VALEVLLRGIHAPDHPLVKPARRESAKGKVSGGGGGDDDDDGSDDDNDGDGADESSSSSSSASPTSSSSSETLLSVLLSALDTASLPSYFWRSLASSLSSRVSEILNRGGVAARTLRSQRETVRAEIRECVLRGSKLPRSVVLGDAKKAEEEVVGNWEREAAVMVGSVVGLLQR